MQGVHLPPATRTVTTDEAVGTAPRSLLPRVAAGRRAMIVYTSGTPGKPRGVVTTHANIAAQVASLVTAWEWRAEDWPLLVLPLHHVHGIINVLTCALWAGARCEMLPKFDAERVWARIAGGDLTLFMAVPTIYGKLITAWEAAAPERRRAWSAGCAPPRMRLMVSGSAALPVQRLERWREISGHVLLERYGMTEIGMALSNPLHGERRPGFVGTPLPGVEVRLVDEAGRHVPLGASTPGEIQGGGASGVFEDWGGAGGAPGGVPGGWVRPRGVAGGGSGSHPVLRRSGV